jgi:glucose-1-phosphate adenylyltransferase
MEESAASVHGTLALNDGGWVCNWIPSGSTLPGPLAAMGVLLFSKDTVIRRLGEDAQRVGSTHDLFRDLIPRMIQGGDLVMTFRHTGYWSALHTVQDYWQAHMDLANANPLLCVGSDGWPIRTQVEVRPPTRVSTKADVSRSLLSQGCEVEGTVAHSILSAGVHVAAGAVVHNAVVMRDTTIGEDALVENAILDSDVVVGPGARVGEVDHDQRTQKPARAERLVIAEQGKHIPARAVVEPDALFADWLVSVQRRQMAEAQVSATC